MCPRHGPPGSPGAAVPRPAGVDSKWLSECAADLVAQKGQAVVLAGYSQPPVVHALAQAINGAVDAFGKTVAAAPKDQKQALVAEAQQLAARVKEAQQASQDAEVEFATIAGSIANIVLDGVPDGGEDNFVTLREVGGKATFDFEPRDHAELGELLGAIDMFIGSLVVLTTRPEARRSRLSLIHISEPTRPY